MDILRMEGTQICGVVACLPEHIVDNREACRDLYGDKTEALLKATGIYTRCVAERGTTSLELGICAARELIDQTGTKLDEIGGVICVTFTPEHISPSDATSAQHRLKIPMHSIAFDINMACSGYCYGLYIASLFAKSLNKKILLLDGDILTCHVSKFDKLTMPLMSDMGTATLIEPTDDKTFNEFSFYTNGGNKECAFIPSGGSKDPLNQSNSEYVLYDDGNKRRGNDIYMDGMSVFKFATTESYRFIEDFMKKCAISPENIDGFVPHQANSYIIDQLSRSLKFTDSQLMKTISEYGNSGSASIPLTIASKADERNEKVKKRNKKKGRFLLAAFGAGLSISVGHIALPVDGCYSIIQYNQDKKPDVRNKV